MELLQDLKIDDLRVIGQSAEREIIFCYHRRGRRVICFDQHAASERIRYENLLERMDPSDDLDSIKSRACHGAIRFGDKLSIGQCEELIAKLMKCRVPFRCAHSRLGVCVLESIDKISFIEKIREEIHSSALC